jgi:hypothetical protein
MGDLSKQCIHQPRHRQVRRSGEEVTVSGMRPPTERDDHHELRRVDQHKSRGPTITPLRIFQKSPELKPLCVELNVQ